MAGSATPGWTARASPSRTCAAGRACVSRTGACSASSPSMPAWTSTATPPSTSRSAIARATAGPGRSGGLHLARPLVEADARTRAERGVGEVRGAHGQVAHAHGRVGGLAAADALEPVAEMAHGAVAERADLDLGVGREPIGPRLRPFLVEDEQALAVDLERGPVAAELQAAVVDAAAVRPRVRDHEVLRVLEGRGHGIGPVPRLHPVVAPGGDGGERRVHAQVPVDDVDPMGEQVREHAPAEVPEVPPAL